MINLIRNLKFFSPSKESSPETRELLSRNALIQPAYDISALKSLVGENSPGLVAIIHSFIEKTPGELKRLEDAVETQNWPLMGAQAHKLRSNLKLFGLDSITDDLQRLEDAGKGNGEIVPLSLVREHLGRIKSVFGYALYELPAELEE